ncbi:Ribosomal RNA small subunit methyltransferase H [Clarias magur]|uniref:Ribosomal RNA small subunit methyltransferase H n=1 Tax=Clarias magur TaxID=1594786 RepID=A0A8J4X4P6_CLAMG|nr:Ribosomal RNA small subunit methyltransferase H [Clarias magur]
MCAHTPSSSSCRSQRCRHSDSRVLLNILANSCSLWRRLVVSKVSPETGRFPAAYHLPLVPSPSPCSFILNTYHHLLFRKPFTALRCAITVQSVFLSSKLRLKEKHMASLNILMTKTASHPCSECHHHPLEPSMGPQPCAGVLQRLFS